MVGADSRVADHVDRHRMARVPGGTGRSAAVWTGGSKRAMPPESWMWAEDASRRPCCVTRLACARRQICGVGALRPGSPPSEDLRHPTLISLTTFERLVCKTSVPSLSLSVSLALPFLALRFPFPERRWREHSDAPKRIQDQEILIAGDNRGALAGQRGRQHDIVVAVATDWGIECVRRDEGERLREQRRALRTSFSALSELPVRTSRSSFSSGREEMTTCWRTQCSRRSLQVPRATRAATSTFVSRRSFTRRA